MMKLGNTDMESKNYASIEDFPMTYFLARNICEDMGVPMSNIKINRNGQEGALAVGDKFSFGGLQVELLQSAVLSSCAAAGRKGMETKANEALAASAGILQMVYGMSGISEMDESPSLRIDQFPGAFMIARHILSPICEIPFSNFQIKILSNQIIHDSTSKNIAYINGGMITAGARDCAILACMMEMSGKDKKDCFVKLLTNRNSVRLLRSLLGEIYESQNDQFAFMALAHAYADITDGGEKSMLLENFNKTSSFTAPSFWIFGLIEKMLAPVRGVRDNIAEKWAPIAHEVWDRIDERRKQMGLPHAPMEVMLRVQAEPFSDESSPKVLQSKLEEFRLWKIKNKSSKS